MMELECGKEEYVRSNVAISKDNKILLPKLVELYAKDTELRHAGINDMIVNHMPCDARNKIQPCVNKKHGRFTIDWVPHDFRFYVMYEALRPPILYQYRKKGPLKKRQNGSKEDKDHAKD